MFPASFIEEFRHYPHINAKCVWAYYKLLPNEKIMKNLESEERKLSVFVYQLMLLKNAYWINKATNLRHDKRGSKTVLRPCKNINPCFSPLFLRIYNFYGEVMEDYNQELRQAQHHFKHKFYSTSIYECGRIIECGMKDLYSDLKEYLDEQGLGAEFEDMRIKFSKRGKNKMEEFNYQHATLGGMILFARYSGFWDKLKSMCESNLSFLKMINWARVRQLRNDSAHNQEIFGRNEALEMLFYTKVFLYDCGLIEGMSHAAPEILDAHCTKCDFKISQQWNFCPNCSAEISRQCHNCNRALLAGHRICPYCDAHQPGISNHDESAKTYKKYAEAVWADWEVTPLERSWLDNKRLELGLKPEEAEKIEITVIPKNYHHFQNLIQAVNIDGVIDNDEEQFLMDKADHLEITEDIAIKMITSSKKAGKKIKKSLWGLA